MPPGGASATGSFGPASARAAADIQFQWHRDLAAFGYNVWYVERKEDIPLARASSAPPARAVASCALRSPELDPACTDPGGVSRDAPQPLFYQVRAYCDDETEGP